MAPLDQAAVPSEEGSTRAALEQLLRAWRAAERRLLDTAPGSPERALAERELETSRVAYNACYARARGLGGSAGVA